MAASSPTANFSACQASNCNACGSPNPSSSVSIQTPLFSFPSRGSTYTLSWYTDARLLCLPRSNSMPFPFGSSASVQSVLIWNNVDLFAFSSSDCSGASLQPSQIVSVPRPDGSTCFSEFPRAQMLAPSTSVLVSTAGIFRSVGLSLWIISPFPTQTCRSLPQPPPTTGSTNALDSVGIIGIFTDYLLPLLLLAFSCRSLLFRPLGSRLTLPQFSKLWHSRSGLQDRCTAWFVTSTLIDFCIQLCLNLSALSSDAFLWNWIGIFPTSMVFRPVMACLIFLNPDRLTACVAIVEGCLMAANTYLRLGFLPAPDFSAPRIIGIVPPLLFTLTNVVFLTHPGQSNNRHATKSTKNTVKNTAILICNSIFGDPSPTINWHSHRVSELVHSVCGRPSASSHRTSQAALIMAANPMSARMLTLLFLATYWILMWFSFFMSVVVLIQNEVVTWGQNVYGEYVIVACGILLFVFPVVFCFHAKDVLTKYYGRFVRMSKLCRRGEVSSRMQTATSFHFAAKHVSLDSLRIITQSVYLYICVWLWTLVIVLLVGLGLFLSANFPVVGEYYRSFFIWLVERFLSIYTILWDRNFLIISSIVLLSDLFASSWFSLFRFFRVENPLIELPKRIASCCCLQFRCDALCTLCPLSNLYLLATRFTLSSCSRLLFHALSGCCIHLLC
jgi:hypothetical protein